FSSRRRHTRFSRDWSSDVCSSDLTTVHRLGAAVVAALVRVDDAVAAQVHPLARHARDPAAVAWLHGLAVGRATISRSLVAVVARLPGPQVAIAADDRGHTRRPRRRAGEVRLDDTRTRTAIARHAVAVVAGLGWVEVDLSVAARRCRHQHAVVRRVL